MDEQKTEEVTTSEAQQDAQVELEQLAGRYSVLDAQIAALDLERQDLRAAISVRVFELGGKTTAAGYTLEMTAPAVIESYDAVAVNRLIARLSAEGSPLAQELAACRKESRRAGGLRMCQIRMK